MPAGHEAEAIEVPALADYEQLDAALLARCRAIEVNMVELAELVARAHEDEIWTRFGHTYPKPYFEERIGLRYRTVMRLLTIAKAIARLPEADRPAFRAALPEVGSHKASVIAPVIGADGGLTWETWVETAKDLTEDALQERVSEATGQGRRRGGGEVARDPAMAFLDGVVAQIFEAERERVRKVLILVTALAESRDPRVGFMHLIALGEQELGAHGVQLVAAPAARRADAGE